ncbi:MAG: hypothetical protein COV29_00250 [Candidatus Yanofskybacteria bacterium CG10_big_fil_rev_8_21_14_0_10_36_16]|uniref:Uncharacterized protein n=1 Tax=Candidatus Yanofskybacteria bacterium CG10_big_fil_rev_8_21_14_0_10_36_16 TaxID=1975096 RepID=A0A2J0Q8L0_9BACT|nr:MAG: hypothetical protein COV29_00250 [Candidatus Yanofskybacteria bacterium CG10_big_fil_rev_8_21_14_0_10_36_16]
MAGITLSTIKRLEKKAEELRAANPIVDRVITVPWPLEIYSEEGERFIQEEIERRNQIRKESGIYSEGPFYVIMPGRMPQWVAEEEWRKQEEAEKLK